MEAYFDWQEGLSIYLSIYLSVCLSVCLSIYKYKDALNDQKWQKTFLFLFFTIYLYPYYSFKNPGESLSFHKKIWSKTTVLKSILEWFLKEILLFLWLSGRALH